MLIKIIIFGHVIRRWKVRKDLTKNRMQFIFGTGQLFWSHSFIVYLQNDLFQMPFYRLFYSQNFTRCEHLLWSFTQTNWRCKLRLNWEHSQESTAMNKSMNWNGNTIYSLKNITFSLSTMGKKVKPFSNIVSRTIARYK